MTDRELLEENNKMLKEILSFVRKVDSAEYRDHQDFMEFLRNVAGSYEQFWIMKESVCPAIKGETGYSEEEFDKIDEKNKNPELTGINTFNDTVKKANEIKDRVLKYVYNIKQERSYNNDMVGIFERYKDIADGDMEVAMNFIKEAYPFNEETEVFIRKKFDMFIPVPIPDELK